MGALWEIVQTGLTYGQKRKSDSVEDRVQALEDQLRLTQDTLRTLVKKLEELHGIDMDQAARSDEDRSTIIFGALASRLGLRSWRRVVHSGNVRPSASRS